MRNNKFIYFYIFLFFASGFSGLIYESIWSHYLKLFLGHAAYAQTLVLSIFMLGLAIGGYWVSVVERRIPSLLIAYAVVEIVVGLFALVFHNTFLAVTSLAYDQLIPGIASPAVIEILKWSLGILLIFPQSILLGATFPLMAGGILKYYPDRNGYNLATLYFCNSFGAALGVIINGFVFIPTVGLPGALFIGGMINVIVAISVYLLARSEPIQSDVSEKNTKPAQARALAAPLSAGKLSTRQLMLAVAAFTGAASFMYEIAWIRMLSLVFGSSTYSFEVMLSAFILGIAIGGLWIRSRIDGFENPIRVLGIIQLAMGTLAAFSLLLYLLSFDLMVWTRAALALSDQGYFLFNLINYGSAALVMLPVTICAGMTLPLITKVLIDSDGNNSSIGQVYAFNTFGSIVGVVFASQLIMPLLGLKSLVLGGALIDLILGALLFSYLAKKSSSIVIPIIPATAVWCCIAFFVVLDPLVLASGVFRSGRLLTPEAAEVLYYKDGKSSSVSIIQGLNGNRVIANNGKPDAQLAMPDENGAISNPPNDESTMKGLPAIGLAIKPNVKTVANIGFGSGLTVQTLLASSSIERIDSIEIEPAVIEAARLFDSRVERAYSDPRSNIVIGDAKTFFVNNGYLYDLIIAEPSNPWVSGVASLFSTEYYELTKRYLSPDGLYLQWLQAYEIEQDLVANIYAALRANFKYVHFYQMSIGDIAMTASNSDDFPNASAQLSEFSDELLRQNLSPIGINSASDIKMRHLADQNVLDILFDIENTVPNSDFYPIVDTVAPKNFFKRDSATGIFDLHKSYFVGSKNTQDSQEGNNTFTVSRYIGFLGEKQQSVMFQNAVVAGTRNQNTTATIYRDSRTIQLVLNSCRNETPIAPQLGKQAIETIFRHVRNLDIQQVNDLANLFANQECFVALDVESRTWIQAIISFGKRDYDNLLNTIQLIFSADEISGTANNQILLAWAYIAAINTNRILDLAALTQKYVSLSEQIPMELRILQGQAELAYEETLASGQQPQ